MTSPEMKGHTANGIQSSWKGRNCCSMMASYVAHLWFQCLQVFSGQQAAIQEVYRQGSPAARIPEPVKSWLRCSMSCQRMLVMLILNHAANSLGMRGKLLQIFVYLRSEVRGCISAMTSLLFRTEWSSHWKVLNAHHGAHLSEVGEPCHSPCLCNAQPCAPSQQVLSSKQVRMLFPEVGRCSRSASSGKDSSLSFG